MTKIIYYLFLLNIIITNATECYDGAIKRCEKKILDASACKSDDCKMDRPNYIYCMNSCVSNIIILFIIIFCFRCIIKKNTSFMFWTYIWKMLWWNYIRWICWCNIMCKKLLWINIRIKNHPFYDVNNFSYYFLVKK